MESQEQLGNVLDPQSKARLRDNKRRSRLRQKQYTAGLEEKLKELQREGVRATQEVQVSARRVVEDNIRLRALLRYKGVDDDTINTWTPQDSRREQEPLLRGDYEVFEVAKAVRFLAALYCRSRLKLNPAQDLQNLPISNGALLLAQSAVLEIETKCDKGLSQNIPHKSCKSSSKARQSCANKDSPEVSSIPARLAPCKLISRLAEDPNTDITQIHLGDYEADQPAPIDGVECSKAYRMLMQFGTTDEKLDKISRALEEGCTVNEGPHGGCRVRNEAIWKAIDDLS